MTRTPNTATYVPPALKRLGTISELTQAAGLVNSDNGLTADNAFPNPS
jgi:hypothetical protein